MPDDYNNLSVLDRSRHHISADNRQHAAPLINEMRGGNQKEKKTEQNSTVQYSTVQYSTVQNRTEQKETNLREEEKKIKKGGKEKKVEKRK